MFEPVSREYIEDYVRYGLGFRVQSSGSRVCREYGNTSGKENGNYDIIIEYISGCSRE